MGTYQHLIVERHGPVGWLINDRPEQLNAMNAQMRDEFADAWRELDADPAVRVIVHTGNGRAFQTGVDVSEIAADGIGMERYRQSVEEFDLHFTAWHQQVWKPVITAVNGICAGGGFHWVADADIVIAASDAQFFDPHVSIGQVVAIEAIGLLRKVPVEAVMRMAFVGRHERMSAPRAYELGMVSEVVDPPERLRDAAQALAEKIARNSPAAMAATKRALWGALETGLTDACRAGAAELVSLWGHPDQSEGPRAFAEGRDPGVGAAGVTMLDLLAGADGLLLRDDRRTWRRSELQARSAEVAAGLAAAGVHEGQAVGVSLPNDGDLVATLFGVWQAGAVHVPINPRLTTTEVDAVVAGVEPAALVTSSGTAARATTRRYEPDVALVQFTSGTTGPPKPVLLRHSGVLALLDNVVAKLRGATAPAGPPPTNLIPVSLSLWAGIYQVLFALRVGAPIVVMARFETVEFARLVREHAVRSVVLPPAAMAMLVDDERLASLEPLRFVRSITAPLSPLQARRFRERFPGIGLLNSYGQTEIGGEIIGWNAADAREHGEAKLGSVGRPHAGVEVRVEAASGELQVRTPAVAAGYADGSDLGDRLTDDGWFRTGDVGRVDEDGFVWIEGRLSDVVNRGGLKVHPGEVEEVLRLVPQIADAAVVGVPDDRLGEVPWAFVVASAAEPPTAARLAQHCRDHLAPYKVPVRFEVLDELPRNEIGKVLVRDLVARAAP